MNAPGEGPGAEDGADESPPGRPDEALALEDEAAVVFWQRGLLNLRDEADPAIEVVLSGASLACAWVSRSRAVSA